MVFKKPTRPCSRMWANCLLEHFCEFEDSWALLWIQALNCIYWKLLFQNFLYIIRIGQIVRYLFLKIIILNEFESMVYNEWFLKWIEEFIICKLYMHYLNDTVINVLKHK